jgi:hypothetical protein
VYVPNTLSPGGVDLVVADTAGGQILRYFGPTGSPLLVPTVVWTYAGTSGPQYPDGLSVDSSGNLYVINAYPGAPQVFVFPKAATATGFAATPILLDSSFNGNEVDSVVETVVVPAAAGTLASGDLLVLTSDNDFVNGDGSQYDAAEPALVYDYPAAGITQVINGTAESVSPMNTPVLYNLQFPYCLDTSSPCDNVGGVPSGMDIWPYDGSLLISTSLGTILQYPLPTTPPPGITMSGSPYTTNGYTTFASPSPCEGEGCTVYPFFKLRTGAQTQSGTTTDYAFVTQSTGASSGNILEFASPIPAGGFIYPTNATVVPTNASANTSGSPMGLTVAPPGAAVVASLAGCATGNCGVINPTGGLATTFSGPGVTNLSGEYLQQTCIVVDTRVQLNGTCPGNLPISNAQCPNFLPNTNYTLPPTMCGASTSTLPQFAGKTVLAAIQTVAPGAAGMPNVLVDSAPMPSALIPGATNPVCSTSAKQPQQVGGWAPSAGEGTQPEGTSTIIDIMGYCDNGHNVGGGPSLFVTGTNSSTAITKSIPALIAYTDAKLVLLGDMVVSADILPAVKKPLLVDVTKAGILLTVGQFASAAIQIEKAYALVYDASLSNFIPTSNYPNPWGDVLARLQNVYYDMNTLISGQATLEPLSEIISGE